MRGTFGMRNRKSKWMALVMVSVGLLAIAAFAGSGSGGYGGHGWHGYNPPPRPIYYPPPPIVQNNYSNVSILAVVNNTALVEVNGYPQSPCGCGWYSYPSAGLDITINQWADLDIYVNIGQH